MVPKALPPRDYINQALAYDAIAGTFRWRTRPLDHFTQASAQSAWNSRWTNKHAGSARRDGYVYIFVKSEGFMAHRLAWLLVYGEPVPEGIDHIDGNRCNNTISNLRSASHTENFANARKSFDNTTGVKGVHMRANGRFQAYITRNYKLYQLGHFDTVEEAAAARREAAKRLHGEFARHD